MIGGDVDRTVRSSKSSQNSSIMSPPPPPSSSQDGWSLNGDYSSAQVKLFLIN